MIGGPERRNNKTFWQCTCDCGVTKWVAGQHLTSGATRACGCRQGLALDLTGRRSGRLTAIRKSEHRDSQNSVMWECICDCGKSTIVAGSSINRKRTTTCGCKKSWRSITGTYWCHVRSGATTRGLDLTVTIQDAWELFESQKARCALTGRHLVFTPKRTASFDRIDSSKGYIAGNVQWVHRDLNKMKQEFDEPRFIAACRDVVAWADHQRPLE